MENLSKITLFVIITFFMPKAINAQTYFEVKSQRELKTVFFNEIKNYDDTLSKNVKNFGMAFIKFRISDDGKLDSISFSTKSPRVLVYALRQILNKIKIVLPYKLSDNSIFVLPLFYDYQPEPKEIKNLDDYLSQVQIYDPAEMLEDMTFDSNGFFKEEESKKELWGIKCTFLPTVEIKKYRVYH